MMIRKRRKKTVNKYAEIKPAIVKISYPENQEPQFVSRCFLGGPLTVNQAIQFWFDPAYKDASCCGLGILNTGADDPFFDCCVIHDEEFLAHHAGTSIKTLKEVNQNLYDCMFKIAGSKFWFWQKIALKERARIYKALVERVSQRVWDRA